MQSHIAAMKVAVYQGVCHRLVSNQLALMETFVNKSSQLGIQLCIFPECFLQGYAIGKSYAQVIHIFFLNIQESKKYFVLQS